MREYMWFKHCESSVSVTFELKTHFEHAVLSIKRKIKMLLANELRSRNQNRNKVTSE